MSRFPIVVAAALACLPWGAGMSAQQITPTFRGSVDLVTLDVSVLGRDHHPVKGLTADDFIVLEDGTPQQLVTFNAFDLPDPPAATAAVAPWLRDAAPDVVSNAHTPSRIVVIVMDDAHVGFDMWKVAKTRQIAHAVVDRLGPDDLAAVTFTEMGLRQNLTADRGQLAAAVDSFNPHPQTSAGIEAMQSRLMSGARAYGVAPAPIFASGTPGPCSYSGASHGPGACVIEVMNAVAQALASAPQGRKTVVWISQGIARNLSMGSIRGLRNPSQEVDEQNAMLRSFQEQNINIYSFNPCGAECAGRPQSALQAFADETGGRATMNTNTPDMGVPQMFADGSSYYLLAFRSSNRTADGTFRAIQVKVNRPGVEVHTRTGYYAATSNKTRTAAQPDTTPAVDRALAQGVPGGSLPLAMTVAPVARGKSDVALAITVALREPLPPGRHQVVLVTTAVDEACPICARQTRRETIEVVSRSDARAAELVSRLEVKPGHRYNVRAAAELNDRTGTVFTDVDVANFAKDPFSVSSFMLSVTPSIVKTQAPLLADLLPLLPSATRDFRRDMTVTAFLRVTQGGSNAPQPVGVLSRIRNEHNSTDFESTETLGASSFSGSGTRSADYRLQLPIATLTAGPHLLTIELSLGKSVLTRESRFNIE
jgi:VWFA-related protein